MARHPAVAGSFYPGDPKGVTAALDRLLPAGADAPPAAAARAVVVPHAAWTYSGAVAGATYAGVVVPSRVVLLGPNHAGLGEPAALAGEAPWQFPGAEVPVAGRLAAALLDALPDLRTDPAAHRDEHALEVHLPFLHRRQPAVTIVPLTVAGVDPGFCRALGEALGRVVAGWAEPVLLVDSTDLNHYESQAASERKDRMAIDAVLAVDPDGLWRVARRHDISMCGLGPTLALLWAAPALGVRATRLVRYGTSGDVSGDRTRVVGYAGLVLA